MERRASKAMASTLHAQRRDGWWLLAPGPCVCVLIPTTGLICAASGVVDGIRNRLIMARLESLRTAKHMY